MSLITLTANGNTNIKVNRRHLFGVSVSGTFGGATVAVQYSTAIETAAAITTSMTGSNNDFVLTRKTLGTSGNIGTLTLTNAGASKPLIATVTPTSIAIQLATDSSSVITTTANDIITLLNNFGDVFTQNYTIALASGNTGAGLVTALGATSFAGGTNGTFTTYAGGETGSFTAAGERVFCQQGINDFININVTNAGTTSITCVVTDCIDF